MKSPLSRSTRSAQAALAATLAAGTLAFSGLSVAQAPGVNAQAPSMAPTQAPMHAHEHRHGHGHGEAVGRDGMMGGRLLQGLNLSETQRDRVFAIMHAQAPALREQGKAVRKAREEMRSLTFSGEFDEGRARAAAQKASQAMADMAMLRARTHNEVFKVLTPEQQAQLRARLERRHDHGPGMQHPGMHRPGEHHGRHTS